MGKLGESCGHDKWRKFREYKHNYFLLMSKYEDKNPSMGIILIFEILSETGTNYRPFLFVVSNKRDRLKNKKIHQHPEDVKYFVRFSYKETITKKYVLNKLEKIIGSIL